MRFPRKFFLLVVLTAVVGLGVYTFLQLKKPKQNIVIISIDTLRPDHMSVYGYDKKTTPNIDAWAKDAVVFTNVSTVVPMTYPSFVALMTGVDPFHTRIIRNKGLLLGDNTKSLPTYLKENGYTTGAFTTGAVSPRFTNLDQGVDEQSYMTFKRYKIDDGKEIYFQDSREKYEDFVQSAVTWLDKNKNKQFFLWLHLMDPHAPYSPPEELRCAFNKKYCSTIDDFSDAELEDIRSNNQGCQETAPEKDITLMQETLYDGGIAYSDRLAGLVLQALKERGLDKNTIVILYGDHGEGFDHNYFFSHRAVLYNSAVHIPLIIKTPANTFAGKSDIFIQNTDVLPTLLDLLGVRYDRNSLQGNSFVSSLTNSLYDRFTAKKRPYAFYMNSSATKFAISDGVYKYIYSLKRSCLMKGQTEELYNVKTDPRETENLVEKKKDVKEKLHKELFSYLSLFNLPIEAKRERDFDQEDMTPVSRTSETLRSLPY